MSAKKGNTILNKIIISIVAILLLTIILLMWIREKNIEEYEGIVISLFGSLIAGVGTLLAVYFTTKETREVQKDNRKEVNKQLNLQIIDKRLIEYKEVYRYFLIIREEMEKILEKLKDEKMVYIELRVSENLYLVHRYNFMKSIDSIHNLIPLYYSIKEDINSEELVVALNLLKEECYKLKELLKLHEPNYSFKKKDKCLIECKDILDEYNQSSNEIRSEYLVEKKEEDQNKDIRNKYERINSTFKLKINDIVDSIIENINKNMKIIDDRQYKVKEYINNLYIEREKIVGD